MSQSDIDRLREKRSLACIPYQRIIKLVGANSRLPIILFEGEDERYYAGRIPDCIQYKAVICDGKSKLLEAIRLIEANHIISSACIFGFVDADFDPPTHLVRIYQTPNYSIENFYCSEKSFKKVLRAEFGVCETNESDEFDALYNLVYAPFLENLKKLHYLNSWFLYQRKTECEKKKEKKIKANKIDISKLMDLNKKKSEIYLKTVCPDAYVWPNNIKKDYYASHIHENPLRYYRGKWVLDIYRPLLDSAINTAKANKLGFKTKKKPSIVISGDGISALSQYADTPDCLVAFIETIKKCTDKKKLDAIDHAQLAMA